jgi:polysaccharide export outer membrane protein
LRFNAFAFPANALSALFLAVLMLAAVGTAQAQDEDGEDRAITSATYRLDAGDVISISVFDEEGLSMEAVEIGDSGVITYPLLGEVEVRGLTIAELDTRITSRLIDEEYLIRPDVTINMVEYRPFYIDGEVEEPGAYPYEPGLTLRRAVSLAGGFTERASRSRIEVINDEGEEAELGSSEDEVLATPVRPGDTITVNQRFF